MELQKVAKLNLEEEAYLKPISDRGIGFYNLDKNTAQFQFIVSKADKPLLISDKNVKGYAFFKAQNGTKTSRPSTSGILDIDFIDPMKGLVGVTVPQWFLKAATGSKVLGELYLSLNDIGNTGKDDTVVLGTFSFNVRDSLVNQIESDIKVEYIRMFDDLRTTLEVKVQQLQKDIGDTTSLVDAIKQTSQNAVANVNKATSDGLLTIANSKTNAITAIDSERDKALREVDALKTNVDSDYQTAVSAFQQNAQVITDTFNTNTTNANKTIDDKVNQFNQTLNNNGFITPAQVDSKLSTLNWQKFPLTNSDGSTIAINNLDFNAPETLITNSGMYYLYTPINGPKDVTSNGMLLVIYTNENYMKFIFTPFNSSQIFIRTKSGVNNWVAWERLSNNTIDTGWVDLQLINGATPNNTLISSGGFTNAYRSITSNGVTRKMVRINAASIKRGQTIALLPKGFVNNLLFFTISTPRNRNVGRVSLNTSGTIDFNIMADSSTWSETDYAYGQIEWTE